MNFCNPKTMGWGCGCKIKKPDFPPYRWPVVVAECEGMKADCNAKCPQDNNINTCYTACTGKYLCNTDKAPPSYLQVSDVNATPAYTSGGTPAATGTNPTNAAGTGTSTSPTDTTKPNGASLVSAGLGSSVAALVAVAYMAL
ncbi:hypothetical protein K7432_005171 [Basidiobolus ranarum]|uniref:Uncharacterized protein n=1 Tax=Basidiobolus ranarum TaxID=34480 RepID=A0ABR2W3J4_9FUNG